MDKHTPAPWKRGETFSTLQTRKWTKEQIEINNKIEGSMIFSNFTWRDEGKSRNLICTVARESFNYESNANLIASAPELLEACHSVLRLPEFASGQHQTLRQKVEQAINKAEGK